MQIFNIHKQADEKLYIFEVFYSYVIIIIILLLL